MNWALIATIAQLLTYYIYPTFDNNGNELTPGNWATETVQPGTIVNLIDYNGTSPYTPPIGTKLEQVSFSVNIGDTGY